MSVNRHPYQCMQGAHIQGGRLLPQYQFMSHQFVLSQSFSSRMGFSTRQQARGLSLVELLVALAIFALMSAIAYGSLDALLKSQEGLKANADDLRAMQFAVGMLERDLNQVALRPVRGPYGEIKPALLGQANGLELSKLGVENPLDAARSGIERVRYRRDDKQLWRDASFVLDQAPQSQFAQKSLLQAVSQFSLRYLDELGQWQTQWPPQNVSNESGERDMALPRAVEFTIESESMGEIRRVIELAQTLPPARVGALP